METQAAAIKSAPVQVLIADQTENAAYDIDALLRSAGIVTRLRFIDDLSMAADHLADADLMLINTQLEDAARAIPALRELNPRLPIIMLRSDEQPSDLAFASIDTALKLGANDLVHYQHHTHLLRACQRELDTQCLTAKLLQNRRSLSEAEQRCQLLLQTAETAIAYVHEGMHIYANNAYLALFGFEDADDLIGLPLMDLIAESSIERLRGELKTFRSTEKEASFELDAMSGDASTFTCEVTLDAARYESEACIQVMVRTAAQKARMSAAASASDDDAEPAANGSASGPARRIPPRHGIGDFLHAIDGAARNTDHSARGMFLVGIDESSRLRLDHGLQGAELVYDRVELMLETIAAGTPCLRINPDVFALYLHAGSKEQLAAQAESYRAAVEELLLEVNEKTVRTTVHLLGVEQRERENAGELLERAYGAYAETKEPAPNAVVMLTLNTPTAHDDEATRILKLISEAIEKQKFLLLFQPIISLRGDSDEHYEVFLRMLDRHGEQMVPKQFLETAIENNVAGKLDRWVILQSIKMLSVHRSKGHATRLTINVTANSITDPEFLQWLSVAIKAARLPSDAVIFQLTERDANTYLRQSREFVEGLKKLHCRSSLSRFGLIDAPFATLDHLPVDMVKVDGSLVQEAEEASLALNETIRTLQSQGKLTVVPMVENAGMLSMLWQAGANYIQGHYLQEPVAEMSYDFNTEE